MPIVAPLGTIISIGFPSCPGKRSEIIFEAKAAELLAGKTLESTCEKTISLIGAAKTERITKESTTTATGLRITNRAVCAHLPSSFGVIELFLTTNLSILFPSIASSAGNATKAPRTAMITTVTPA